MVKNLTHVSESRSSDILGLEDKSSSELRQEADFVLFTFLDIQKNGICNQTTPRPKASNQCIPGHCPVRITGSLIDKIRGYNLEKANTPINLATKNGKPHLITYKEMMKFQKGFAKGLGENKIGFPSFKIELIQCE